MKHLSDSDRRQLKQLRAILSGKRTEYLRAASRSVNDFNVVGTYEMKRLADLHNGWIEALDAVLAADVSNRYGGRRPNSLGRN
jgi:hypothetical protein